LLLSVFIQTAQRHAVKRVLLGTDTLRNSWKPR